jgi:hypothetical protein
MAISIHRKEDKQNCLTVGSGFAFLEKLGFL